MGPLAAWCAATLTSALLATVVLRVRSRHYRRICAAEERDTDADGVTDIYQTGPPGPPR